MQFTRNLWPGAIWAFIALLLTGLPGNYFPTIRSFWDWLSPDKIVHLIIFGTLSFLILWGYRSQYITSDQRYKFLVWATVASIFYGGLTEILQKEVFVGRDGNIFDFLANVVGAFLGTLLFYLLYRKKSARSAGFLE